MTRVHGSPSISREITSNWRAIVWYWDFLPSALLVAALFGAGYILSAGAHALLLSAIDRATSQTPTVALLALTLSIGTLTFLSSVARNRLFRSAARAGALTDFATFSWWEGFVSILAILAYYSVPLLPVDWAYVVAGLLLYVVLGLLGLLTRLTQIVYRYAGELDEEDLGGEARQHSETRPVLKS